MSQPIVIVSADAREFGGVRWHAAQETYLEAALETAGVTPLIVPSLGASRLDLDGLLARVDGLLLTGAASNVHPGLYGEEAAATDGPFDADRDGTTLPLVRKALSAGMPLLAICRGMQELNVALGGTLLREIHEMEGYLDHHTPQDRPLDERYAIRQDVEVRPEGCLARLIGAGRVEVNSLHRQGIDKLADGLRVEAIAPDGVVEAVSVGEASGFALATQWHPEYWVATDRPSARIFEAFGEAVREYRAGRNGLGLAAE